MNINEQLMLKKKRIESEHSPEIIITSSTHAQRFSECPVLTDMHVMYTNLNTHV